jgi:hypothetical protein
LTIASLTSLGYIETGLCLAAISVIVARKQWSDYWSLGSLLAARAFTNIVLATVIHFSLRIGVHLAYKIYFYFYWISFAVESVIALVVVYSVFRLAMAPLKGLQTLGTLVFKWAAGISVAVALGGALAPHLTGTKLLQDAVSQLQRTQSILTLCLLLFVSFAVRPMGLSYSSRIFGVSLGLSIMATNDLVQSAWLIINPGMASQCHQRRSDLRRAVHLDYILCPARAEAPPHRSAHHVTLPALEPDLPSSRRQPRLRGRGWSSPGALRPCRA